MAGQTTVAENLLVAIQHTIPICTNAFGPQSALVHALGDLATTLRSISRLQVPVQRSHHGVELETTQDEDLQEALRNCLTTVSKVRGLARKVTRDGQNVNSIPTEVFDKIKQFAILFRNLAKFESGDRFIANKSARNLQSSGERDHGDAWHGELVLSLDGGGVRGFVTLILLEELRNTIAEEESHDPQVLDSYSSPLFQTSKSTKRHGNRSHRSSFSQDADAFRLCHYFDYICGSSFGGMAAVMLGTMRWTVDETLAYSRNIWGTTIHTTSKLLMPLPLLRLPNKERNSVDMRDKLQSTFKDSGATYRNAAMPTLNTTDGRCQTIVFAIQEASDGRVRPYAFRSYALSLTKDSLSWSQLHFGIPSPVSDTSNVSIVDACLATSAVPSLYRKVKIPALDGHFVDGGIWRSDPSEDVYRELQVRHQSARPPIRALLSIGGRSALRERSRPQEPLARAIDRIGDLIHDDKERFENFLRTRQSTRELKYDRILCETTTKPSVHIARMLDSIEQEARNFVRTDQKTQEVLRGWAAFLVKTRQQRSRTARWAVYAGLKIPHVGSNSPSAESPPPQDNAKDSIESRLYSAVPIVPNGS